MPAAADGRILPCRAGSLRFYRRIMIFAGRMPPARPRLGVRSSPRARCVPAKALCRHRRHNGCKMLRSRARSRANTHSDEASTRDITGHILYSRRHMGTKTTTALSGFPALLTQRWAASGSLLCIGIDPDPRPHPGTSRARPGRTAGLLHRNRRRDGGPGLCVQAADRLLFGSPRRGPARGADRAHPRPSPRHTGDTRRQARGYRRDCFAIRARGLRALSGRCGDGQPVHGLRLDRTLARTWPARA